MYLRSLRILQLSWVQVSVSIDNAKSFNLKSIELTEYLFLSMASSTPLMKSKIPILADTVFACIVIFLAPLILMIFF